MNKVEQIWKLCLKIIRDNIDEHSFRTWFAPIIPKKINNDVLTIQVPSEFFCNWLEEHYIDLLKKTIKKILGPNGKLEYSIVISNNAPPINIPSTKQLPTEQNSLSSSNLFVSNFGKELPNPFVYPGINKIKINSQLVESFCFDNFVEGDCNRLARSASIAVAQNPGKTAFNPLFIHSPTGLGKTHLAHAIGIEAKKNYPELVVLFVQTEQFINQFIEATTKTHNLNDFIQFYKMIELLILDDIHALANKIKSQDALFQIFNYLHQAGKQIVMTSDKPPVEFQGIEPRLLSRFKWGLTAELQQPDFETRKKIIQKKLHNFGASMPDDVIEYLAQHINTNIRELEGSLISLIAQSSLNKKDITIELAQKIVTKYVKQTQKEISINDIQQIVSNFFSISVEQMNSRSRKRDIVQARQIAMYFAKKYTPFSLTMIGQLIGNKDHATVLHSCKTVNDLLETDIKFKKYIDEIDKKIRIINKIS